jgi:hypothetical protein
MDICMPARTTRKIGTLGLSQSRYVILPRSWCDGTGIGKGSRVELLSDGVLVVVPPGMRGAAGRVLAALHGGDR